jgi:hypothetical protein
MRMDFLKYFSYYFKKIMISPCYFGPPVLGDPVCVEVSLFVASPEIEGRTAVEADNWARHKKTFYPE